MPQSLVRCYVHIVFSTKHRQPCLFSPVKEQLWAYLGELCRQQGSSPICIGGYTDHVHLLCELSKKSTLVKLVDVLKANSSRWMKTKGHEYEGFYWQAGYGAFSVSQSQLEVVRSYILRQEEHHQQKEFQAEFRHLLKKHELDWDERYVWD
ncbi:IS200/IS605 family transposase [Cesiribacter andamanensis]|uniref:Transposase n=1 Tax=Cesiribacter andamanensis AMV16 TaxID=1279009 RepID=M7N9J3_9BACT|nr:IS200/IS605 family transposase [Cesiribacter andamanensis]EMR03937.1 Transposase [Cesiribacter andamanensis AMV16]